MHNADMKRTVVAVLFGGRSVEHEISIISALQMIEAMDSVEYEALPVYIAPSGKWYCGAALLKRDFYKRMPESLKEVEEVVLLPVPGTGGLTVLGAKTRSTFGFLNKSGSEKTIPVDVFFPVFHGSYGEDGCIQGLLELADVVYTGCDVVSSAVSMSKFHSKKMAEAVGIPVLPAAIAERSVIEPGSGKGLADLRAFIRGHKGLESYPLFVKPAHLGSSIGIGKAVDDASLDAALVNAFKYDWQAIIEPCLDDKLEINVSVLDGQTPTASVVEIPVPSTNSGLSYEDKYLRGGGSKKNGQGSQGMAGLSRIIDPDDLDPEIKKQSQEYARQAFLALGCSGVVRLDFMLDLKANILYFNEINPLPGSLSFYLWKDSKPPVLYTDLISQVVKRAQKVKKRQAACTREIGFAALFR